MEFEGAFYHVIVRGNQRREIFRDEQDRLSYLQRLEHYRERYRFTPELEKRRTGSQVALCWLEWEGRWIQNLSEGFGNPEAGATAEPEPDPRTALGIAGLFEAIRHDQKLRQVATSVGRSTHIFSYCLSSLLV